MLSQMTSSASMEVIVGALEDEGRMVRLDNDHVVPAWPGADSSGRAHPGERVRIELRPCALEGWRLAGPPTIQA